MERIEIDRKNIPPVVVGPVIMLIGLSLAPNAIDMAKSNWWIALASLLTAIAVVVYSKGLFKLIPVFSGILIGYLISIYFDQVDFNKISEAAWFQVPNFIAPKFSWGAIVYMIPVAIAPIIEHVGDVYAIGAIAEKDFVKKPSLHRTLLGDGVATIMAGFFWRTTKHYLF